MVWSLISDQLIVSGLGEVIGLNHLAVWEVIDRYKVSNPVRTFEKIIKVFRYFQENKKESNN